jgi:hypothetical protein
VAGSGTCATGPVATGATALGTSIMMPSSLALDGAGNIYLATETNGQNYAQVLKISASDGKLVVMAGAGPTGYNGDGPALSTQFSSDTAAVQLHPLTGEVYFTDVYSCVVRQVDAAGTTVTTVAGMGAASCGFNADSLAPLATKLWNPVDLAFDSSASAYMYISDQTNQCVRKVALPPAPPPPSPPPLPPQPSPPPTPPRASHTAHGAAMSPLAKAQHQFTALSLDAHASAAALPKVIYTIAGVCTQWTPMLNDGQRATLSGLPNVARNLAVSSSSGDVYMDQSSSCGVYKVSAADAVFRRVMGIADQCGTNESVPLLKSGRNAICFDAQNNL